MKFVNKTLSTILECKSRALLFLFHFRIPPYEKWGYKLTIQQIYKLIIEGGASGRQQLFTCKVWKTRAFRDVI
ncbi:hypothetical protein J2TS4_51270 [Paenibacillus sp. J2TS4]|nr:hypothetical protein J2TS4_51270 [Paenibacillus sp. J2TS4]